MLEKQYAIQFEQGNDQLFDFEYAYLEKKGKAPAQYTERTFNFEVIERCNKETEELIQAETASFLSTPIQLLKQQQEQFIYLQSPAFETIRVDAVVLEFDEMFKTYAALFGLKLQKKYEKALRAYLHAVIPGKTSLSFAGNEGIWEVNIFLSDLEDETTIESTMKMIYQFIFTMLEAVEAE